MSRPSVLPGTTRRMETGCGPIYVTINRDPETNDVQEIFAKLGKAGGCGAAQTEAVARVVSIGLQSGTDIRELIKQLKGIQCHTAHQSCADAIGRAMEEEIDAEEPPTNATSERAT